MAELAAQQRRGAPAGSQSEGEADVSLFALREEMNEKWTTIAEQKARTLFNRNPNLMEARHKSTMSHVKLCPRMCNFMLVYGSYGRSDLPKYNKLKKKKKFHYLLLSKSKFRVMHLKISTYKFK